MKENPPKKTPAKLAKGKAGVSTKKAKLTTKQRKLVKGIAEGKTQRQAAKDAGLNEQYASGILKEPEVKATLLELMDNMGLSDECLLKKHKELLSATRGIDGDATPDYPVQAKALEMGYKLRGAFIEKAEIKHSGEIIHKIERTIVRP